MAAGDPAASTADSLRALRRGLQRSRGRFALFLAVCDRAEARKELIRLLGESMPGTELEVTTLNAETTDPLPEVLAQVGEGGGPVMVLGLERTVPMARDDAPILRALNLERSEWPERLRRPVVFWVPEALLGALGRTAPDFLDWRSDTLYFPTGPERLAPVMAAFDASLWQGGSDRRMSVRDRWARVEELQSRLRGTGLSGDSVVEQSRASWLLELGNHLLFLGALASAWECYEESLSIFEEMGDRSGMAASYHQLGVVAQQLGRLQEARNFYQKSARISEELENYSGMAVSSHQLGTVAEEEGRYEDAIEWYRKSLQIFEELGIRHGMAASYHQLGNLSHLRRAYDEALEWYRASLRIEEELSDRGGMAGSYHQLGRVAEESGRHEEAQEWYRRSLEISEELGYREGIARNSSQIGLLLTQTQATEEAVSRSLRALAIRQEMEVPEARVDLDALRRQREALGNQRFRELVEEHAESPDLAAHVLEATAEPLDERAQEVAEAPADYGAGGRSDGDD